jgi:hypothetical protein
MGRRFYFVEQCWMEKLFLADIFIPDFRIGANVLV